MRVLPNSVRSSNLVRLGYKGSTLYVEFKNGRFYRYDNVPWPRFTQMLEADSVGRFFCQHIKPLPFVRLEQDPFESETDQQDLLMYSDETDNKIKLIGEENAV